LSKKKNKELKIRNKEVEKPQQWRIPIILYASKLPPWGIEGTLRLNHLNLLLFFTLPILFFNETLLSSFYLFTFCEVSLILLCLLKTHIIKIITLNEFMLLHPNSFVSLNEWVNKIKVADWNKPDDIKNTFATADLLGNNSSRVIFNIGGNKYRLIVKYYFGKKEIHLFICWIGTHAAYTKLCKEQKQYYIHIF
jgi:mRNA interferase HigB